MRTFAQRYPDQTLGLVLLDPAHEQQLDRLPAQTVAEFEQAGPMFRWAARYWQAAGAEVDAFDTLAAAPPDGFGEVSVMIISARRDMPDGPPVREVMDEFHRQLAARTPQATHHSIDGADHLTVLTVDEHARTVSNLLVALSPQASDQ